MPLAVDRRVKILERVAEEMSIHVADLARDFGCSEMTIRRDILRLERDGFLRRTYGGATAHLTRSLDLAFNSRALANAREKRLIALEAVRRIDDAQMLYLGIGTTAEHFARYLPARTDLTVVTGSLPIASMLGTRPSRAVILGGSVRRDELSCVGPVARAALERYRFDLAVLGTAGLTARWGLTDLNDEEAEIHRLAIERSGRLMVIADGSKLGQVTGSVVAPASSVGVLVTDASAPESELAALRALGIEIVIASASDRRHDPHQVEAGAAPSASAQLDGSTGMEA
ncbi:MAG: DeoR/GlpR family DNA-binding transcription regulator [Candidatus Limnocylindrales bacterium]|jgi:DeoR/GlpR family transcriptional regulator of sugar metabolism